MKEIPNNIIKKSSGDTEEILLKALNEKYGERFSKYRNAYYAYNKSFADDSFIESTYPLTVVLELINRCNLGCIMCDQGFRNDIDKVTMSDEILTKIFKDFKNNKLSALMISVSEPLLYKNIRKVLDMAKEAEVMDLFLFTNGTLLDSKRIEMILDSSVTRLFVSIDADSHETYGIIRPTAKGVSGGDENRLDKLERNIRNFIDKRNSLGRELPLVRVSFVSKKENKHEVESFVNKWIDIVDSVEIQEEISINAFDNLRNEEQLDINDDNFDYKCNQPWGQMTIYSNGQVAPCCTTIGNNIPIGNVINESISEIWNGKKMQKVREGFISNNPNIVCKQCIQNSHSDYFDEVNHDQIKVINNDQIKVINNDQITT
jgi:radical SAM protein with 4Fe4S-binding SPASM domain